MGVLKHSWETERETYTHRDRQREREREREIHTHRERERERERVCVCVCVCEREREIEREATGMDWSRYMTSTGGSIASPAVAEGDKYTVLDGITQDSTVPSAKPCFWAVLPRPVAASARSRCSVI